MVYDSQVFAFILVIISIALILLAFFSKRIKKISADIEEDKIKANPAYAKRRDVSKFYCPKCKEKIPDEDIREIKKGKTAVSCPKCHVFLEANTIQMALSIIGILGSGVISIVRRNYQFSTWKYLLLLSFCITLIIVSLCMEKLREVKERQA